MILNFYDDFNIVYAKKMGLPKRVVFDNKKNVIEFLLYNIDDIDFLSINEVIIDKNKLIYENKLFLRYLKLIKLNEL
jgi:hypothetical protein